MAAIWTAALSLASSLYSGLSEDDPKTPGITGYNKQLKQSKLALLSQAAPELLESLKISKKQAKGLGKQGKVSYGGQLYRIPNSDEYGKLVSQIESQQFAKMEETRQKLADSPLFKSIFARAGGDFGMFDKELTEGFAKIGSRALGASSALGTINNASVANRALGPLALERAQFLQNLQLGAEGQAINATLGLPFSGSNLTMPTSIQGHQQGLFNQYQFNTGVKLGNAQMINQGSSNKSSYFGGLGNSLAGFAGNFAGGSGGGMFGGTTVNEV